MNTQRRARLLTLAACALSMMLVPAARAQCVSQQKLRAHDGAGSDFFAPSVSISGDRAIVGAPDDTWGPGASTGSAYIFERRGNLWVEAAKLVASDGAMDDTFGTSVALSGNRALVGSRLDGDLGFASGSAYVFDWNGTGWVQSAKLLAADGTQYDSFGGEVALDGDRAVVAAFFDDDHAPDSGSVYVFDGNGTAWVQSAKLTAADGATDDGFGQSLALEGGRLVVGAPYDDDHGEGSGSAYVFDWNGTSWVQTAKLTAADGGTSDRFGGSVALNGDRILVGANNDDDRGVNAGAAYVFEWNGSSWVQTAKLTAADAKAFELFGNAVALRDDRAVVTSLQEQDQNDLAGSAYIFAWDGHAWAQQAELASNDHAVAFGWSAALDGNHVLVGAPFDLGMTGAAYVFDLDVRASWSNYGQGWPGTTGIPALTASGDPLLCASLALEIGNSLGGPTTAALLVGAGRTAIFTWMGGTLLVDPPWNVFLFALPAGGLSLPVNVPCDGVLCGIEADLQSLQYDPGASRGVAFSPGLALVIGG
jgi:hypothetical protein